MHQQEMGNSWSPSWETSQFPTGVLLTPVTHQVHLGAWKMEQTSNICRNSFFCSVGGLRKSLSSLMGRKKEGVGRDGKEWGEVVGAATPIMGWDDGVMSLGGRLSCEQSCHVEMGLWALPTPPQPLCVSRAHPGVAGSPPG